MPPEHSLNFMCVHIAIDVYMVIRPMLDLRELVRTNICNVNGGVRCKGSCRGQAAVEVLQTLAVNRRPPRSSPYMLRNVNAVASAKG